MEEQLENLLTRLDSMTERAQQRWVAEEFEGGYEPDSELWLTMEKIHYDGGWRCGWRVQEDEATDWAIYAAGATPRAAAQALLALMEAK